MLLRHQLGFHQSRPNDKVDKMWQRIGPRFAPGFGANLGFLETGPDALITLTRDLRPS